MQCKTLTESIKISFVARKHGSDTGEVKRVTSLSTSVMSDFLVGFTELWTNKPSS